MQKIKNNSGLALGAAISLIASLFVTAPAASANENAAVISPKGDGATSLNSMLITETFEMRLRYGTGVAGATNNTVVNHSIHYVVNSTSPILILTDANGDFTSGASLLAATSISGTADVDGFVQVSSASPWLSFGLLQTGISSLSSAVSITVTPFIELDGTTGMSAGDSIGTPYTINFVPWSALGASLTLADPAANDRGATASVALTAGTIRWSQLDGFFGVAFSSTGDTETAASGTTVSAQATGVATPTTRTASGSDIVSSNYSFSAAVLTAPMTTSATSAQSISAQLYYFETDVAATANLSTLGARALGSASTKAVSAFTIAGVTISAVSGANIRQTSGGADARVNSEFTVQAFAHTTSVTTSMAVAKTVTVSAVGAGLQFGTTAGVILNGTTYTSSAALRAAGFTLGSSVNTFTAATFGQDSLDATDTFTLRVASQGVTEVLQITLKTASLTVAYAPTAIAGLAGQTKSFTVTVADQWNQTPVRTDLRVRAEMSLASSLSSAVGLVSAGTATVALAPLPATRTGSGTVTFTVQVFNQDTQTWDATGTTDSATWNVYSYAAGTEAFTSRTAAVSASVSYGVRSFSWSGVVAVGVANSFSDVVVSAPGLVIEDNNQPTITASGTLTVAANGLTANLRFAGTKPGTYTVTFTQGTASTTSVVTISAAGSDRGDRFTFDTSSIDSGKTRQIVGTLLDANGNPVDTTLPGTSAGDSGTASILITVAGTAGIVASTLPTETDANGQFRLSVLTAAADSGALVITATYYRGSTATATFTTTQTVTVAPAAAPEVNAVIGSFNGRWAVRVENARGSVVSVKAGNRWVKFSALNNNYLFSRKSVVGRTIAVSVWVDGELQNSQTITIK